MNYHVPGINEVECPSGAYVNVLYPDPATIHLADVAHKLAQCNRFAGSAEYPYSVAQHAVFVSMRVAQQGGSRFAQLAALHHDDHEAYVGDMVRPVKPLVADWEILTANLDAAIADALDLPLAPSDRALIKPADRFALFVEARNLMPSRGLTWTGGPRDKAWDLADVPARIVTPRYWWGELPWRAARDLYILRHEELAA